MIQALVAKFATQLIVGAVVAAIAGLGFLGFKRHYTNIGYHQHAEEVAADNREAIDASDKARERVRACRDTGGVWDTAEGQCTRR